MWLVMCGCQLRVCRVWVCAGCLGTFGQFTNALRTPCNVQSWILTNCKSLMNWLAAGSWLPVPQQRWCACWALLSLRRTLARCPEHLFHQNFLWSRYRRMDSALSVACFSPLLQREPKNNQFGVPFSDPALACLLIWPLGVSATRGCSRKRRVAGFFNSRIFFVHNTLRMDLFQSWVM